MKRVMDQDFEIYEDQEDQEDLFLGNSPGIMAPVFKRLLWKVILHF